MSCYNSSLVVNRELPMEIEAIVRWKVCGVRLTSAPSLISEIPGCPGASGMREGMEDTTTIPLISVEWPLRPQGRRNRGTWREGEGRQCRK